MKRFDFLIMGGGPVGSSIAFHLARRGAKRIAVVEQDCTYRRASAMLSAGGIRQQFSVPENIKMSMYGAEFIKNRSQLSLEGEDSPPDFQFHEHGYLFLSTAKTEHILLQNQRAQHAAGAVWIDALDQGKLRNKFGDWLNIDDLSLGTFGSSNEGYFDPWMLVSALKRKAVSLGVEYIDAKIVGGQLVPATKASSSSYLIDKVTAVLSKSGSPIELSAENYINSAGAWSGRLVDDLAQSIQGKIHRIPVAPRKRCIFAVHCRSNSGVPPTSTPLVIDPTGVYFRPEGNRPGSFLMGVSPAEAEDRDVLPNEENAALSQADEHLFQEIVWPTLAERVPAFQEIKVTSSWAGFYDYNALDQNAIIGHHSDVRNLVMATGFSGHGLQQAPAAGRAVSELMLDGKFSTIDLYRFSYERIVDKKPIFETGIV